MYLSTPGDVRPFCYDDLMIIYEILSPRPKATNYATFRTMAEAKAALADPTRFPEMQGYRIFQFLY